MRLQGRAERARRQGQGAMEGRLGASMVRAAGRLRTLRQGPDRFGAALGSDSAPARRPAAARLPVRDVSRRGGAQGLEVDRPRRRRRAVAALRADRGAQVFPDSESAARAQAFPGIDSAVHRRVSRCAARMERGGRARAAQLAAGVRAAEPKRPPLQLDAQLWPGDEPGRGAGQRRARAHLAATWCTTIPRSKATRTP